MTATPPPFIGIFIDIESNGLHLLRHVPLEVALVAIQMDTGRRLFSYVSKINCSKEFWDQSSLPSLKIHGISYQEIEKAPLKSTVGDEIKNLFTIHKLSRFNSAFIGQNSSFDRAMFAHIVDPDDQERLGFPYYWLEMASMHFAKLLSEGERKTTPWETGFSKNKIAAYYGLKEERYPHNALAGVEHLITCYEAVVGFPALTGDFKAF